MGPFKALAWTEMIIWILDNPLIYLGTIYWVDCHMSQWVLTVTSHFDWVVVIIVILSINSQKRLVLLWFCEVLLWSSDILYFLEPVSISRYPIVAEGISIQSLLHSWVWFYFIALLLPSQLCLLATQFWEFHTTWDLESRLWKLERVFNTLIWIFIFWQHVYKKQNFTKWFLSGK